MSAGPVWAGPYKPWIAEDGRPFLADAVLHELPCGCKAVGNGTLPHPLTVDLCRAHFGAAKLRQACADLLEIAEAVHASAQPGSIVQHECAQAINAAREALELWPQPQPPAKGTP